MYNCSVCQVQSKLLNQRGFMNGVLKHSIKYEKITPTCKQTNTHTRMHTHARCFYAKKKTDRKLIRSLPLLAEPLAACGAVSSGTPGLLFQGTSSAPPRLSAAPPRGSLTITTAGSLRLIVEDRVPMGIVVTYFTPPGEQVPSHCRAGLSL